MNAAYWLASQAQILLHFLNSPGLPDQGWGHPCWARPLPHQSLILKMFHTFACKESDGGIFFNCVPSSQITLAYVKLTKS